MYILVMLFHLLICLILIGVVMLQAGKGAEMGAAFGGFSPTLFGPRGTATFLSKLTIGVATLFMLTSLTLAVMKRERSILPSASSPLVPTDLAQPETLSPTQEEPSSPTINTQKDTTKNEETKGQKNE